jgi:tRNA(His) guanylyltransferase
MTKDSLGDRMKRYEAAETERRFMPQLPIYARLDGRSFSQLTKGMDRPFDLRMTYCMIETMKFLVQTMHATIGYTQSDEISLVWKNDDYLKEMIFDGKIFKLTSVMAAMATARFNLAFAAHFPSLSGLRVPTFDCRVFQLPNLHEAANAILWRVNDAVKNSVSMAASAYYSHNELHGKNSTDKHEMLFAKGINWNDYPRSFKEGSFAKRVVQMIPATEELKESFKNRALPTDGPIEFARTFVEVQEWPAFKSIENKVDVLFNGAEPILKPETVNVGASLNE